jgi:hypothetical protein
LRRTDLEATVKGPLARPVGKIQRVPLREVWKHEALSFTTWLRENIDVLSEGWAFLYRTQSASRPLATYFAYRGYETKFRAGQLAGNGRQHYHHVGLSDTPIIAVLTSLGSA